jgi:hypothetical protein
MQFQKIHKLTYILKLKNETNYIITITAELFWQS